MKAKRILTLLVLLLGAGLLSTTRALAQKQDPRWFGPFRLSAPDKAVLTGAVEVADHFGFVHAFWAEGGFENGRYTIQYSRFDGTTWSAPVDILVSGPDATMTFLFDPVITQDGILHLMFTEKQVGPLYYLSVPVMDALSAQNWVRHPVIRAAVFKASLVEGQDGALHLMYSVFTGGTPGLYYMTSTDGGESWSLPRWIDPDIPSNLAPTNLTLAIDPTTGILHAVYRYETNLGGGMYEGQGHYYIRSLDNGQTWSEPHTLDIADESGAELRGDGLQLVAYGGQVHSVWAGTEQTNRDWAYSLDSGETWSTAFQVFGSLQGSAGDGMAFDGLGDFHFFAQIRWPQGIYEIDWDGSKWGFPGLIYLVRNNTNESIGDRIHAHYLRVVARRGNQLVILFTDPPGTLNRGLYTMHRTLDNIPPEEIWPTPEPTSTPTPFATPVIIVPEGTATPTLIPFSTDTSTVESNPGADLGLSILAVLLLMVVVVIVRIIGSKRR